jgi:alkylhydroperoxidase/carboxymuconolactone decarboxylase family protein YurZ
MDLFDCVGEADPELMEAFAAFAAVPVRRGALDPLTHAYIGIAVNAATTHLYEPALRAHIRQALALGAEQQDIVEVLELTSVLGIHTATMAMPVLAQELQTPDALDEHQQAIKARFLAGRGMWRPFLEDFLKLDPELLEAYIEYSTVPWKRGRIERKVKELIYIAIDASPTHLYETGTRMHIQNALAAGATQDEILEVLELIAQLGIHACTMAIPVLLEEVAAQAAV